VEDHSTALVNWRVQSSIISTKRSVLPVFFSIRTSATLCSRVSVESQVPSSASKLRELGLGSDELPERTLTEGIGNGWTRRESGRTRYWTTLSGTRTRPSRQNRVNDHG